MQLTTEDRAHLYVWADALESGRYPQQRGVLSHTHSTSDGTLFTSYCCLGVERVLAGADVERGVWYDSLGVARGEGGITLPSGVALNGLVDCLPWSEADADVECETFSGLNDVAGCSFPQIADVVRYLADNLPTQELECS